MTKRDRGSSRAKMSCGGVRSGEDGASRVWVLGLGRRADLCTLYLWHRPFLTYSLHHPSSPSLHIVLHRNSILNRLLVPSCAFGVPSLFLKFTAGIAGHPVAMPSSQPTPSSHRVASSRQMQSALSYAHDQTVYDDGSGHRIVDSRRRSRMGLVRAVTTQADRVSTPTEDAVPSRNPSTIAVRHRAASGMSPKTLGSEQHVTRRTERLTAKPPVIIGAPRPATTKSYDKVFLSKAHEESTPPPTPRVRRLSTPDLPDLAEAPFCGCGFEAPVVKYCTRCGAVISSR